METMAIGPRYPLQNQREQQICDPLSLARVSQRNHWTPGRQEAVSDSAQELGSCEALNEFPNTRSAFPHAISFLGLSQSTDATI